MSSSPRALPAPSEHARHWRLDPSIVFLNHGSFGACPTPVLEAQQHWRDRLESEPVRFFVHDLEPALDHVRAELGKFLNADRGTGEGLVFVPNATAGVNTVLASLRLSPGDELLTNSQEYNACNNALRFYAEKAGATVVSAEVPFPIASPIQAFDAIMSRVTSKTRLVMLSHITSPTGIILPIEAIVAELNGRGIDSLVDGAHAPGMAPVDIDATCATYYTGNCHKWMCTPKGSAFLWARPDKRASLRPLVISHGANSPRTDRPRYRLEFDYTGTLDLSAVLAIPEAIKFMPTLAPTSTEPRGTGVGGVPVSASSTSNIHSWSSVMATNHAAAIAGRDILCAALKQAPPAPASMLGSLAAVRLPDRTPEMAARKSKHHDALNDALMNNWGIEVPLMVYPFPNPAKNDPGLQRWVRIAMQRYNSLAQVEYLAHALVEELKKEGTWKNG